MCEHSRLSARHRIIKNFCIQNINNIDILYTDIVSLHQYTIPFNIICKLTPMYHVSYYSTFVPFGLFFCYLHSVFLWSGKLLSGFIWYRFMWFIRRTFCISTDWYSVATSGRWFMKTYGSCCPETHVPTSLGASRHNGRNKWPRRDGSKEVRGLEGSHYGSRINSGLDSSQDGRKTSTGLDSSQDGRKINTGLDSSQDGRKTSTGLDSSQDGRKTSTGLDSSQDGRKINTGLDSSQDGRKTSTGLDSSQDGRKINTGLVVRMEERRALA